LLINVSPYISNTYDENVQMNNWNTYFEEQKLRESLKKENTKKNIKYLLIAIASILLVSLLAAVIGSPALAKLIFGSLFALLGIAAAIAHIVFYYWVIAAVFQDEGISGGLVFLFLCGITCYIYYIYYAFMNCTPLVAVLSSFGALLAKSLAAAAVYTYTGGAFTIPLFGMQIVPV
jgi:CBS domain containing-hemolysin-like protein